MNNNFRDTVIERQIELIERGINYFGSQVELANFLNMKRQQLNRYYMGNNEMKWSTYLTLKSMLDEEENIKEN